MPKLNSRKKQSNEKASVTCFKEEKITKKKSRKKKYTSQTLIKIITIEIKQNLLIVLKICVLVIFLFIIKIVDQKPNQKYSKILIDVLIY